MVVMRFMSKYEFTLLMQGATLTKKSGYKHARTNSHGFCLLNAEDYKAIVAVIVIGCTVAVAICDAINKAKRKNRRKHK